MREEETDGYEGSNHFYNTGISQELQLVYFRAQRRFGRVRSDFQ